MPEFPTDTAPSSATGDAEGPRCVRVPVTIRWSDLDAYQHVNNARLLTLLEEARIQAPWLVDDAGRPASVVAPGTLTLVARHEIEYLAQITYRAEPIDIEMWVSHLGAASCDVAYRVLDHDTGREHESTVYAIASSTLVFVDERSGRPRRLTEHEREVYSGYLGPRPPFRRGR